MSTYLQTIQARRGGQIQLPNLKQEHKVNFYTRRLRNVEPVVVYTDILSTSLQRLYSQTKTK